MATSRSQRRLETLMGHLKAGQGNPYPQPLFGERAASGRFRYTLDGCILSEAERKSYEENGFVVVRGLVGEEMLKMFRERFKQICQKEVKVRQIIDNMNPALGCGLYHL